MTMTRPESSTSNTSGAVNAQLPEPMHRSRSATMISPPLIMAMIATYSDPVSSASILAMALQPSPAVARASDLLHYLAQHPLRRFTVSELARDVGLPRATCDTLLLALAGGGFVR